LIGDVAVDGLAVDRRDRHGEGLALNLDLHARPDPSGATPSAPPRHVADELLSPPRDGLRSLQIRRHLREGRRPFYSPEPEPQRARYTLEGSWPVAQSRRPPFRRPSAIRRRTFGRSPREISGQLDRSAARVLKVVRADLSWSCRLVFHYKRCVLAFPGLHRACGDAGRAVGETATARRCVQQSNRALFAPRR
jgi:hypothetical protein